MSAEGQPRLRRELGVFGATMMGLGSMVGTGVFVSVGLAAGAAGPSVVLATAVAALLATCNALSSAQLAASHPVSGGTYEYGYRYLTPALGFAAGWTFLLAKTASAATAALGFSGYLLQLLGVGAGGHLVAVALAGVGGVTTVALLGMRRSSAANVAIVSVTLATLIAFVATGAAGADLGGLAPFFAPADPDGAPLGGFLRAAALMFVAFTGYGRIATLGEEVGEPARTIPSAIVATVAVSAALYVAVAWVAVGILGAGGLLAATRDEVAPLVVAARATGPAWLGTVVAAGAVTAMLGVLLNLVLGLSRVLLAMGRRGDAPVVTTRIGARHAIPWVATIAVAAAIAGIAALGRVELAWSFSAFTVLVYYAITNLAALRLPAASRRFSRAWAWAGLGGCLSLAFQVEAGVWGAGLALLAAGLAGRWLARRTDRESLEV